MLYATAREDLKNVETEPYVMPLQVLHHGQFVNVRSTEITISDSDYPIQVLHQNDDVRVYLLLNNEVVVGDSIDFDFMHDECEGSNLTEDKSRCWDCDGGPG